MSLSIRRGDRILFEGETSTAKLGRKIEVLTEYLLRAPTPSPAPACCSPARGIIVTQEAALAPGDICTIASPAIGILANEAALV